MSFALNRNEAPGKSGGGGLQSITLMNSCVEVVLNNLYHLIRCNLPVAQLCVQTIEQVLQSGEYHQSSTAVAGYYLSGVFVCVCLLSCALNSLPFLPCKYYISIYKLASSLQCGCVQCVHISAKSPNSARKRTSNTSTNFKHTKFLLWNTTAASCIVRFK